MKKAINTRTQEEYLPDVNCPNCNGNGYTAEHDPSDPHKGGVCRNCPIQVQCEHCEGTGKIAQAPEPDYKAWYLEGRELLEKCSNISPDFQSDAEILKEVQEYLNKNGNEKTI